MQRHLSHFFDIRTLLGAFLGTFFGVWISFCANYYFMYTMGFTPLLIGLFVGIGINKFRVVEPHKGHYVIAITFVLIGVLLTTYGNYLTTKTAAKNTARQQLLTNETYQDLSQEQLNTMVNSYYKDQFEQHTYVYFLTKNKKTILFELVFVSLGIFYACTLQNRKKRIKS